MGTANSDEQSHEYTRYVTKNSMINVVLEAYIKYIKRTSSDLYLFYRILSRYYFMLSRNSKTCCLAKSYIVPEKNQKKKKKEWTKTSTMVIKVKNRGLKKLFITPGRYSYSFIAFVLRWGFQPILVSDQMYKLKRWLMTNDRHAVKNSYSH
jgi:hypothetical protein